MTTPETAAGGTDAEMDILDRRAAVEVMGFFKSREGTFWKDTDGVFYDNWHPTRDIAQAWMVLEKFPELTKCIYTHPRDWWICDLLDDYKWSGGAKTAPLAIVLACLVAAENKK